MNNDIVIFKNRDLELEVSNGEEKETVWLSANQMSLLFGRVSKTIRKHINNALKEEIDDVNSVIAKFATTASDGKTYMVEHYNLDIIISVGYRVKSPNGIIFHKWTTSILKDYMIKGYAINQKRLKALNRIVEIQSIIIASTLELDQKSNAQNLHIANSDKLVEFYSLNTIMSVGYRVKVQNGIAFHEWATTILNDYMIKGYAINQKRLEALNRTDEIQSRIIASTLELEDKATNLLYFMIKDHPLKI